MRSNADAASSSVAPSPSVAARACARHGVMRWMRTECARASSCGDGVGRSAEPHCIIEREDLDRCVPVRLAPAGRLECEVARVLHLAPCERESHAAAIAVTPSYAGATVRTAPRSRRLPARADVVGRQRVRLHEMRSRDRHEPALRATRFEKLLSGPDASAHQRVYPLLEHHPWPQAGRVRVRRSAFRPCTRWSRRLREVVRSRSGR